MTKLGFCAANNGSWGSMTSGRDTNRSHCARRLQRRASLQPGEGRAMHTCAAACKHIRTEVVRDMAAAHVHGCLGGGRPAQYSRVAHHSRIECAAEGRPQGLVWCTAFTCNVMLQIIHDMVRRSAPWRHQLPPQHLACCRVYATPMMTSSSILVTLILAHTRCVCGVAGGEWLVLPTWSCYYPSVFVQWMSCLSPPGPAPSVFVP
jgi:hypothetical protein